MAADLAGGVGDVDDLGRRGAVLAAEDAVGESEVQRGPDHDDQVGCAERLAARLGDQQGMATGHDATAHAVGDGGKPGVLHQPQRGFLGAVGPHVAADDEHRPRGLGEQPAHLRDRLRVGVQAPGALRRRALHRAAVEERVHRDIEEDRSPVAGASQAERGVHGVGDLVGPVHGGRPLGDRLHQGQVVKLLEAPGAPAVVGGPAADDHERRSAEARLGDRADAVGDAGTRGQDSQPGYAGQLPHGFGGEHGGLLVADVEEPHRRVGLDRAVVHREDVRTGEREHGVHPVGGGDRDRMGPAVGLDRTVGGRRGVGGGLVGTGSARYGGRHDGKLSR